ncbi:MAG: FAD-binding oxidoreductase [Acidimicrobiales bacterium]
MTAMTARDTSPQPTAATDRPIRRALAWRQGIVTETITETATARSLVFDVEGWDGHIAGQHFDLRLTAEDGYQATRSYSLSSGPDEPPQITVERVADGEVSPYLVDFVEQGDSIELRGPIGGYFVWEPSLGSPLLVGGGSGIAPLRAIWRARNGPTSAKPTTVLYSAQSTERLIFADELTTGTDFDARIHLTRATDPAHRSGRIGAADLEAAIDATTPAIIYVCGPTAFVETIARHLVELAVDPRTIRTERFG